MERPQINLNVINTNKKRSYSPIPHSYNARTTKNTRNGSFAFNNAKEPSRAEQGLKLIKRIRLDLPSGILHSEGIFRKVDVIQDYHRSANYRDELYTFRDENGKEYTKHLYDRFNKWDFYILTEPVPFVPKKTRRQRKRKSRRTCVASL